MSVVYEHLTRPSAGASPFSRSRSARLTLPANQEYINIENYIYLSETTIKNCLVFGRLDFSQLCTEIQCVPKKVTPK